MSLGLVMAYSLTNVKYDIDSLLHNLSLDETEDTWDKIANALKSFTKICENGAYDANPAEVVNTLRSSHRHIISAMNSERTRLSLVAMDFIATLPTVMGREFEQVLPLYLPPLLLLCSRTSKVVISRARSSIFAIIESAQLATVLSYFMHHLKDKSASLKVVIAEGTLVCLNSCNPPDLEKEARALEVEAIIRSTARDANADVRKISRKIFESYKILLPSRVPNFTDPLSPTTKKYLDIKTSVVTTQKSTLSLRSTSTVKLESKPSASTSNTKTGHSRVGSTSTLSNVTLTGQTRNAPTTITKVVRKEPVNAAPIPSAPARPVQPARLTSDPQSSTSTVQRKPGSTTGPVRPVSTQERTRPMPPVRSQSSVVSRGATAVSLPSLSSGAPHRVQLKPKIPSTVSTPQTTASSGPRRVPVMGPPPPPPPAAAKDKEGPKRPIARTDNAISSSSHHTTAPKAPLKKIATSASSSSSKDRIPVSTGNPAEHLKSKSTAMPSASGGSNASSSTKPLTVAKSKPLWGRSAPAAKPAPTIKPAATAKPVPTLKPLSAASQREPVKAVTRKPSSHAMAGPKHLARSSKARPITPAMVALPPSPTIEEVGASESKTPSKTVDTKEEEDNDNEQVGDDATSTPKVDLRNISPVPSQVIHEGEAIDAHEEIVQENQQDEVAESTLPITQNESAAIKEENEKTHSTDESEGDCPLPSSTNQGPQTPQGFLSVPTTNNETSALAHKTPISALLSSIEHGFMFSPITPLSPADLYLPNGATPYSHKTHAAKSYGPRQPFNHALHAHVENGIFGGFGGVVEREEQMIRGDIGVIKLDDHNKLFSAMTMSTLEDGTRHAFVELNQ